MEAPYNTEYYAGQYLTSGHGQIQSHKIDLNGGAGFP